ncbi:hydrogen gas-evolving membrane-bound hydrogenase subunit E [Salidesulfovibrio brasiliensis]|uniref:hydrogen gas-evolving membrane-bound hydrogenase subunit E n=1 Tax=Salidesulfovibrio brasiliensis TaxID=221711 RepID=UPI0006D1FFEF|nr:hydrogen gas-evolving membrane-bound hydrogenase subunit E [Salidesulfovibrio brasiliensis]
MKKLTLAAVVIAGLLLAATTLDFPKWGDPQTPASMHVSARFIEKSLEEMATPNIVTAVLGNYRAFDTMLETIVVFTAGLACFFILRTRVTRESLDPAPSIKIPLDLAGEDLVVKTVARTFIPMIQLFGLYVLAHGHYSPGGGFQGGVIFAAAYILLAVSHDMRTALQHMSERATHLLSAAGVLLFAGIGVICMTNGVNFLDYGGLAGILGMPLATGHSFAILLIETGVGLTVTAALIMIFKLLSSHGAVQEGF